MTAGYSDNSGAWQNEELGVHLSSEPAAIGDLVAEFEQIWADAHELSDRTVGITLDETTSATVRVACIRPPVVGEFVTVGMPARTVGKVTSVSSYNPTVPAEAGETEVLLGLRGGGGGRRSSVPDVETLFAHPSKTHAFPHGPDVRQDLLHLLRRRRRGAAQRRPVRRVQPLPGLHLLPNHRNRIGGTSGSTG